MRERKYVKFKIDMYEDTKFKIIDRRPERDLIHYVWSRIVVLAGKVNLEGELYLSKNIPYTAETLAIEFNRDTHQVKLVLEVLIELEMIELNEDNIYVVKNFAKYQNIKVKEKNKSDERNDIKVKEIKKEENSKSETLFREYKKAVEIEIKIEAESVQNNDIGNIEITNKDIKGIDMNVGGEENNDNSQNTSTVQVEKKKNKRQNKNKKKGIGISSIDENDIVNFYEGEKERPLMQGESFVKKFTFSY